MVPARRLGAAGFFLVFVMGFFSRLKSGLARTRVNLVGLFSGGVVDEEFFESLEETLIAADIGYKPTSVILQRLRDTVKLKGLKTREEVRAALRDEIERILLPAQKPMNLDAAKPLVIMMAGVNGAGKTTTIGKIAKWLAAQNKTVLLAAADTFRAAAREQLAVWGERNKIDVITQSGGDPAAVVFDAVSAAALAAPMLSLPIRPDACLRRPTSWKNLPAFDARRAKPWKAHRTKYSWWSTAPTVRTRLRRLRLLINMPASPVLSLPNWTAPPKACTDCP